MHCLNFEVCKRHGLEQTIADTLGPGISRSLRLVTAPLGVCEDMTEVCPNATMLNYVKPNGNEHMGNVRKVSAH